MCTPNTTPNTKRDMNETRFLELNGDFLLI